MVGLISIQPFKLNLNVVNPRPAKCFCVCVGGGVGVWVWVCVCVGVGFVFVCFFFVLFCLFLFCKTTGWGLPRFPKLNLHTYQKSIHNYVIIADFSQFTDFQKNIGQK